MNDVEEGDLVMITEIKKIVSYPEEQMIGTIHRVMSIDEPNDDRHFSLDNEGPHYWLKHTPSDVQFWTRDEIEPITELEITIREIGSD